MKPTYKVQIYKKARTCADAYPYITLFCPTLDFAVGLQKALSKTELGDSMKDDDGIYRNIALPVFVYVSPVDRYDISEDALAVAA